ncbi:MAG: hypothetical protein LR015_01170 [Verrucomicrobia bacterium]|nr:hypothetical protein [Verrucomicrobiota bacterium]
MLNEANALIRDLEAGARSSGTVDPVQFLRLVSLLEAWSMLENNASGLTTAHALKEQYRVLGSAGVASLLPKAKLAFHPEQPQYRGQIDFS